jgi:hypothetical protein
VRRSPPSRANPGLAIPPRLHRIAAIRAVNGSGDPEEVPPSGREVALSEKCPSGFYPIFAQAISTIVKGMNCRFCALIRQNGAYPVEYQLVTDRQKHGKTLGPESD